MADDPYKYFRVEARELLEQMGQGVLALEREGVSAGVVGRLLRVAHTLKGAARVVKQREIADHAHAVEEALAPHREGAGALPHDRIEAVLRLVDAMGERLAMLTTPGEPVGTAATGPGTTIEQFRTVRADIAEMDDLLDGIAETYARIGGLRRGFATVQRAQALADRLGAQWAAPVVATGPRVAERGGTERAGALIEELRNLLDGLARGFAPALEQIDRELRQVRDAAEGLRLVPANTLFASLERAARDVAQAQGKRITFDARGGHVRLDAHVLGVIQGSLVQLVRNAVAHGIEPSHEREASGKSAVGSVALDISRRGRRVVFACRDDGRGVDLEAVRRVVERKGWLSKETHGLGADALVELLLKGGISTSQAVTELAGRGIGLDVVRDAATQIGGSVAVRTERGQGTTVELVAPVSVASLQALLVDAGGVTAALPLDAVRATLRVGSEAIAHTTRGESLLYEGRSIPFLMLARLLSDLPAQAFGRASPAVIIEGTGGAAAIGVDRLLGTTGVVLRPLPDLARADAVIAGASLDAEGNPQLVLDPDALIAEAGHERSTDPTAPRARRPILIIDDSLTTRMLEQSILESAGHSVDLATSAEEALELARRKHYALFLVDVEMPGMDGFTFIEQTRADPALRDIPSILVTSRGSPEDRARGRQAGAQAYIVKSEFDQAELLRCIATLGA